MLPRSKRLTRGGFTEVSAGKRLISRLFSVSWTKSTLGRASVVVSKKVARKAVDRNELKRRMRAVLAPYVGPGRSFVVYARSGSATLTYPALKRELEALLAQLPSASDAV